MDKSDSYHFDEELVLATILCCAVAITLALFYTVSRIGFLNPLMPLATVTGVSLFLLCFPVTVRWLLFFWSGKIDHNWLTTSGALLLFSLAMVVLCGLLSSLTTLNLSHIFLVAGPVSLGSIVWRRILSGSNLIVDAIMLIIISLFSLWVGSVIWGSGYLSALYLERLSIPAEAERIIDTLYHSSITAMIKTYGVPSTGVHGLPVLQYHTGSHWLFAQSSHLLRMSPLNFYQLGYPIIFVPYCFYTILTAALTIRSASPQLRNQRLSGFETVFGLFIFVAIQIGNSNNNYQLISESHLMGISFLMITLGLAGFVAMSSNAQAGRLGWSEHLFLATMPILLGIQGMMKISIIAVMTALAGYFFVRWKLFARPVAVLSMTFMVLVALWVYYSQATSTWVTTFAWVPFSVESVQRGFDLTLKWSLIALVFLAVKLVGYQEAIGGGLWKNLLENRFADVEAVLVIMLACGAPVAAGLVYGVNYFLDIIRWVVLAFLLANLSLLFRGLDVLLFRWLKKRPEPMKPSYIVVIGFLIGWSVTVPTKEVGVIQSYLSEVRSIHMEYSHTNAVPMINQLASIGLSQGREKPSSLLFIPKSNAAYWRDIQLECSAIPFLAPALTGLAMLDGFPPDSCQITYGQDWAYENYSEPETTLEGASVEELCMAANSLGYSHLLVLESAAAIETINCSTAP